MRHLFYVLLCSCLVLGCKKDPPAPELSPSAQLLTAAPWLFGEYYTGYGTTLQQRVYKRGAPGNVVDFSDYRYHFKKDGTFELTLQQETLRGAWKFVNGEQQIEITFPSDIPIFLNVSALGADAFSWAQDDHFARMIMQ